jgi:hypothetical protein
MAKNVEDVIDQLLVDLFLESQETAPRQIILDSDGTDVHLYGKQEGRFFRYLPLVYLLRRSPAARARPEILLGNGYGWVRP